MLRTAIAGHPSQFVAGKGSAAAAVVLNRLQNGRRALRGRAIGTSGPSLVDVSESRAAELAPVDEESRARARLAAANIIARRKGVTLGGLDVKDLIK